MERPSDAWLPPSLRDRPERRTPQAVTAAPRKARAPERRRADCLDCSLIWAVLASIAIFKRGPTPDPRDGRCRGDGWSPAKLLGLIAKDTLDVHLHPAGRVRRFANDANGCAALIAWLRGFVIARVAFDPSGAYAALRLTSRTTWIAPHRLAERDSVAL
jgi:hypothetical protein